MKLIIITSPIQNVGKTTLAMLLTISSIKKNKRVLAIDADIGRYTFTERLGLDQDLKNCNVGIKEVNLFGNKFGFGFCTESKAIQPTNCDICIVDFDLSRSFLHAEFYLPQGDLVVMPKPPWTKEKIIDWYGRFLQNTDIKGEIMEYPVAFTYEVESYSQVKWNYPELYQAWKKYNIKIDKKETPVLGVPYSQEWGNFINFKKFDKVKLEKYIDDMTKNLQEDFKKWIN